MLFHLFIILKLLNFIGLFYLNFSQELVLLECNENNNLSYGFAAVSSVIFANGNLISTQNV